MGADKHIGQALGAETLERCPGNFTVHPQGYVMSCLVSSLQTSVTTTLDLGLVGGRESGAEGDRRCAFP